MAEISYTGRGRVSPDDFRYVKWVGTTKAGKHVEIIMPLAFCRSNPDWTFNEKDDVVPEIEFEGAYTDKQLESGDRTEPWKINIADGQKAGNGEILLGVGTFYVGPSADEYDAETTYALNDLCMHNKTIYKCTTAISTAEIWTAEHWAEVEPKRVGLTRGGGSFVVEREYREINADGDPGLVKDRIEKEMARPKLKMKTLQWLTKVADLYPAIVPVTE